MNAAVLAPPASGWRAPRFRPGRALRLEVRHSPAVWVLPVVAALFYFVSYRTAAGYPPTWTVRAAAVNGPNLVFLTVIAAGIAAWAATRESRRKTGDLLATTARTAWARRVTVLAATAFWLVLAYLAEVAVIDVQTAFQATWGGPPLWPTAVGALVVATACVAGFTGGTLLPGRFTAPITAVAVFAAWFVGINAARGANPNNVRSLSDLLAGPGLLVPANGGDRPPFVDAGVYYHVPPDVFIAQAMFTGGVLLVLAGVLALVPVARGSGARGASFAVGRWLRPAAAAGAACGVAACATAFALAGTARFSYTTMAWEIPALHDAASDQPVPYALDCTASGAAAGAFAVCVHPAFAPYLGALSAALRPAAAEIAGLPGAPARVVMTAGDARPAAGTTSAYEFSPGHQGYFWVTPAAARLADWQQSWQQDFLTWFVSGSAERGAPPGTTPAQEAVAIALLAKIGAPIPFYPQFVPPPPRGASAVSKGPPVSLRGPQATAAQITAAAHRFEALPPAARRAWLTAHLAGLRSGAITLAQVP